MARRTDTKQRMVQAATQLIRERGYNATAFSDVLARSETPRGSVYFHFPGGKPQLATEAAEAHAHEQVAMIDAIAAEANSPAQLALAYVNLSREGMTSSGYGRGCGIAPLVLEGAAEDIPEIGTTSRRAFTEIADRLSFHFVALGLERPDARALADAVLAAVEGAMITARALRSPEPYDSVEAMLATYAGSLESKPSSRKRG